MRRPIAAALIALAGPTAAAQSLFHAPLPAAAPAPELRPAGAATDSAPPASAPQAAMSPAQDELYAVSLYAVKPPEPRVLKENDLVTILVSESSRMKRDGKLDTKREYDFTAPRIDLPDLVKFFALNGEQGLVDPLAEIDVGFESETKSKGNYERNDAVDARITARVVEVKPNGTLLLEAKSVIETDDEVQTFLVSGVCRAEDVTARNTVLSSQVFDLRLKVENSGEIRQATKKGLFPIILETLFNF